MPAIPVLIFKQSRGQRHTLFVRNVTREDLGNYSCQASNQYGNNRATVMLTGIPSECEFVDSVSSHHHHPVRNGQCSTLSCWSVDRLNLGEIDFRFLIAFLHLRPTALPIPKKSLASATIPISITFRGRCRASNRCWSSGCIIAGSGTIRNAFTIRRDR